VNKLAITIPPEEIHYAFIRASGPGGQNVNKVATAVQLRFNPTNSRFLEPEVRERLLRLAGRRVNSLGEIVIEARRFRRRSRPPAASKLRRLDDKRRRAEIKKLRSRAAVDE
jgi:ribosome-associated protein